MRIDKFAVAVSNLEGKKKQMSIAQIKEVLKVVNTLTTGIMYTVIRGCDEKVIMKRSWGKE